MADYKKRKDRQKAEDSALYFSKRPSQRYGPPSSQRRPSRSRSATLVRHGKKRRGRRWPRAFYALSPAGRRALMLAGGGVLCIGLLVFTLWVFLHHNAYEVYVGDMLYGTIAMAKTVDETSLNEVAEAKLREEIGANVCINEKMTLRPVRASRGEWATPEYVIGKVYRAWPYEVEAGVVVLNGVDMVSLKTEQEAWDVLQRIAKQYVNPEADLVEEPSFENVTVLRRFTNPEDIDNAETAFFMLNARSMAEQPYTVQSGDAPSTIAARHGMTLEALLAANPHMNTPIKQGDILTVIVPQPLVSVTTIEAFTYPAVVEKEIDYRDTPDLPRGTSRVVLQGRDGEKEVTVHIVRTNGFETERRPVSQNITVEPIVEIIERGTGTTITTRN